jgi:DNA repair photolyase
MLSDADINVGVGMAPILPGLSDDPEKLAQVVRAARDAGARFLWWNVLNLRPGTREHFLEHLARDWPEELERYQRLYADRAYLRGPQTAALSKTMEQLRSQWVWEATRYGGSPAKPHLRPNAQLELPLAV